MGMTLADFEMSWKTPVFKEELNIIVNGFQYQSRGDLSWPGAFPFFTIDIALHR